MTPPALLSDSEREQLFDVLKAHAAAGRLDVDELERRVGIVAQAQTREDVALALAGLPPLPSAQPAGRARSHRGHGESETPDPAWQPTSERFRDPRSQRIMRVWVDGAGGRHYVAEDGQSR